MKIPEPRKLKSGTWFIQLRLNGVSVPVKADSARECKRLAGLIKAEHLAGKKEIRRTSDNTIREEIDRYIGERSNTLSPVTIRGYRIIQKNRFAAIMDRKPGSIRPEEWQGIVNDEAATCAPKTLKNAWGFLRTIMHFSTGSYPPKVELPAQIPFDSPFLGPDEIKVFVTAISTTKYGLPALLALSSLRISEIEALRWENIPKNPKLLKVAGAVVPDENNQKVRKDANKNVTSTRSVPLLIPELADALERDRQPSGPVLVISQNSLRYGIKKTCEAHGLPDVGIHGLRHSFASLAYHLQIPEKIAAEIGGWSDLGTMHKIYTHIAQADVEHYKTALAAFYAG